MNTITRGIILGGSIGFLLGLLFTNIQHAFGLGMISGFLAGVTLYVRKNK